MRTKEALSNLTRELLSYLPLVGFIAPPGSFRPNGISLCVRTKNEEWIDLSLQSVKEFADEIVVVDTSTDNTPDIIRQVSSKERLNLKLIRYDEKTQSVLSDGQTYTEQSNIALDNTSYRWLFKWDGDMIARTSGNFNITRLRERILNLNNKKHYIIFMTYANLDYDFYHTLDKDFVPSREAHLFTYSPKIRFTNRGRFEELRVPLYYKPLIFNDIYIFHLRAVKSAVRLLYRRFWTDWRELGNYTRFPNLQDYIKYRVKHDWGIEDIDEAARLDMFESCKRLIPFDRKKYGEYPELLGNQLENPRYKLITEQGIIKGRNDIGLFETPKKAL